MAIFQGIVFLIFGVGLIVVDWQSLARGWLPCGPKGLSGRLEFRKDEQPFQYWAMFSLYGLSGIALTVFALCLLFGDATPLPLS
jgi:hypothetical protein